MFASYLVRLTAIRNIVLPRFLFEYLASRPGQSRIRRFITRGVSQANINATNLKSIETPAPSLEVQRDFVDALDATGELVAALAERHATCRTLMTTLIERELNGTA